MSSWSRRSVAAALAAGMASLIAPQAARAQAAWPTGPLRLVVPFSASGAFDILTRLVVVPLTAALGVSVVMEKRTGAGGNRALKAVARSNDEHTFLVGTLGTRVIHSPISRNPTVDPDRALSPAVLPAAVPPSLRVAMLQELPDPGRRRQGGPMHKAFLRTPEAQARLLDLGAQPLGGRPEQMASLTAPERSKWQAVVTAASIKAE